MMQQPVAFCNPLADMGIESGKIQVSAPDEHKTVQARILRYAQIRVHDLDLPELD